MKKYHLFAGSCYYATSDNYRASFPTLFEALATAEDKLGSLAIDWYRICTPDKDGTLKLVAHKHNSHQWGYR